MRTTVAVLLVIVLLFVGVTAISESAQQSKDTAMNTSNATSDAWNLSTDVFGGTTTAASSALVYGGIGAIILVALGILVAAGNTGGR